MPDTPPPRGYTVTCTECAGEIFTSRFYDVAERYGDVHADATGHTTDLVEAP